MRKITIKGKTIKEGMCSCLDVRVESRRFGWRLMGAFPKIGESKNIYDNDTSLTEDEIIRLLNEAEEVKILERATETVLKIQGDKR
jgi:hypothetical protein